jgi:hypothetical protein
MFVESDDASLKSHTYRIERFSKHFSELFQSHQSFLIDWSFLIDNVLIANVNFKELSSLRFSCEIKLHCRIFQRIDISTKTNRVFSQCRIYYVDWFDYQCFLVHVSYKVLFFKTSYEHQDYVSQWHINDVVEEYSSIFFVDAINDEHRFIFFDHHRIVWCIDHLIRERDFIYETIQIICK